MNLSRLGRAALLPVAAVSFLGGITSGADERGQPSTLDPLPTAVDAIARPNPVTGVWTWETRDMEIGEVVHVLWSPERASVSVVSLVEEETGGQLTAGFYESDGTRLANDGPGPAVKVNPFSVTPSGYYFYRVKVTSGSGVASTHTFSEPSPPSQSLDASFLRDGTTYFAQGGTLISPLGDYDHYRFRIPRRSTAECAISLTAGLGLDVAFRLFDEAGNAVGPLVNWGGQEATELQGYSVLVHGAEYYLTVHSGIDGGPLVAPGQTGNFSYFVSIPLTDAYLPGDTDGDGFTDGIEEEFGSSPTDPGDVPKFGQVVEPAPANMEDALQLYRLIQSAPQDYVSEWDINLDDEITLRDAEILYRWSIGAVPEIPLPEL